MSSCCRDDADLVTSVWADLNHWYPHQRSLRPEQLAAFASTHPDGPECVLESIATLGDLGVLDVPRTWLLEATRTCRGPR